MKKLNLIDQRFGKLLVIGYAYSKNNRSYWRCLCNCGNRSIVMGKYLKSNHTTSCGCYRRQLLCLGLHRGKKHTDSSKKKISKSKFGKPNYKLMGRPKSEAHKKKLSESRIGKHAGVEHWKYNPNLTKEERIIKRAYSEYGEWRIKVYEKDKFTCQRCGDNKGGNLNAHHIEGYTDNPELRIEVSNGITLCEDCHKNFHHQYGYGNNIKEQVKEFLKKEN